MRVHGYKFTCANPNELTSSNSEFTFTRLPFRVSDSLRRNPQHSYFSSNRWPNLWELVPMVVMEGGGEVKRVGEEVDGEMIVRKEGVVDVVDGEMVLVKDGVVELGKQWSNQLGLKIGELFISSEEEASGRLRRKRLSATLSK
ncbi:uncharacterized protein LOC135149297 [Daucus carota subsp. sativus]|uniref:uncharacterized protein LOC135149297 n=1 Tax=Daucus carota subsp. sativus TaxID=79200 RepID=UPI0030830AD1